MAINPDVVYRKTREDLLDYEDARFAGLMAAMANFYTSRNDQTMFGDFLRAVAGEIAQLEYLYTYNLVNKEPQYLTPADIKRRWADPLQVSSDYPASYQGDRDYKTMLQALLVAFREGTTIEGVTDVVKAYTDQSVQITELYKQIGSPGFDFSDRNSIRVAVSVGSDVASLNKLQTITADLYNAIALAKPAHVGIDFSTVFSENESMEDIIDAFSDELRIRFRFVEANNVDMFTLSPFITTDGPTKLAAVGQPIAIALAKLLTPTQYNALPFASFKAEYIGPNDGGNYDMNPMCYMDVLLTDHMPINAAAYAALSSQDKALYTLAQDGNYYKFTGEVSKGTGILAPRLNTAWEISNDELLGLDLS